MVERQSPRKAVVATGATGLLGRAVMKELNLRSKEFQAIGTGFSRATESTHKLDITDSAAVSRFVEEFKPQAIVHCAAERRPDVSEDKFEVNVGPTKALAELCAARGIYFVYVSTDYVFDGRKPRDEVYGPKDVPNPLNAYGRSKWQGEEATRAAFRQPSISNPHKGPTILRVPVLYGDAPKNSESAVNILLDTVHQANDPKSRDVLTVDDAQPRYPTNVQDVARVLVDLCTRALSGQPVEGTFHFSSQEPWTKYKMCQLFCELQALSMDRIKPAQAATASATRPDHIRLSTKELESIGISVEAARFQDWWKEKLGSATHA